MGRKLAPWPTEALDYLHKCEHELEFIEALLIVTLHNLNVIHNHGFFPNALKMLNAANLRYGVYALNIAATWQERRGGRPKWQTTSRMMLDTSEFFDKWLQKANDEYYKNNMRGVNIILDKLQETIWELRGEINLIPFPSPEIQEAENLIDRIGVNDERTTV